MKKILTRSGIALVTVAVVIAGAAAFSAYEAHIVNVTATIDNATNISTSALTFGQVFPQEILNQPVTLALSQSFTQSGALGVDYVIKQKPKCQLITTELTNGQTQYAPVTENQQGVFECPAGYELMPLLCPFLSKTSPNTGDTSIPSFHGPTTTPAWTDAISEQYKAVGHLTQQAPSTTWNIDLHVPCFKGECAQDWVSYVKEANRVAVAADYMLDPALKGKALGCDLWYELTSVNRAPTQKVGAANYVPGQPTCNITVGNNSITPDTIQRGVDLATEGQTVCVAGGNYNEFVVNKPLTVRGLTDPEGGSAAVVKPSSASVTDLALVTSNNVTITGLQFDGSGTTFVGQAAGIRISPVSTNLSGVDITYNVVKNIATASGSAAKGVQWWTDTNSGLQLSNSNIKHNTISNISAATKGGYGVQTVGAMSNVAIQNNTISDISGAWGAGVAVDTKDTSLTAMSGNSISLNQIMSNVSNGTSRYAVQVENSVNATGIVVQQNNIETLLHGGGNTFLGTEGSLNAQSNWWGTATPTLGADVFNTNSNVTNFTLFVAGAYPQN